MYSYKNIKNSAFKMYRSAYGIYILKLVDKGNLLRSKVLVEICDIFGNRMEISKRELIDNYVDNKFKSINLYKYRHNVQYIVLKKEDNYVYGCYVDNKVKLNVKFRQLVSNECSYVVCGIKEDGSLDRSVFTGLEKRLFRSFYKPINNTNTANLTMNKNKVVIDTKSIIDAKKRVNTQTHIQTKENKGVSITKIEVTVHNRLIDNHGNLVGFRLYDKGGNVLNLTVKELMSLCDNKDNTKVINASVRLVDGKKYLYGIGISLKDLPAIKV